jgi:exopolysaccharide biosynthesis polyprenyl glycosylphosphotransferase
MQRAGDAALLARGVILRCEPTRGERGGDLMRIRTAAQARETPAAIRSDPIDRSSSTTLALGPQLRLGALTPVSRPASADEGPGAERSPRLSLRARLVLLDSFAIVLAWILAELVAGPVEPRFAGLAIASSVVLGIGAIAASRLYRARVSTVRSTEFARLGPVTLMAAAPAVFAHVLAHREVHVAATLFLAGTIFVALVAERSFFDAWLRGQRVRGRHTRPLIIVGTAAEARELSVLLRDHAEFGYRVVGFVGPDPEGDVLPAGSPWLGEVDDVLQAVERAPANGVLIASDALSPHQVGPLVRKLSRAGIHIHLSGGLWGLDHRRIRTLPIAHEPLFYVEPLKLGQFQTATKRLLDVVMASAFLLVTLPILALAALAIRLDDGGPALFRQPRVGLGGRSFLLLKLRTMRADEDDDVPAPANGREGPLFKSDAPDPRITRVGRLLRATSFDELPQLINVIRGDMSLVGPRPALRSETDQFDDELLTRHRIRPGITGLWQVEARDNPSFRPYRRLDLFYVENWSLMLDLVILMMTVEVVVARAFSLVRNPTKAELTPTDDTYIDLT